MSPKVPKNLLRKGKGEQGNGSAKSRSRAPGLERKRFPPWSRECLNLLGEEGKGEKTVQWRKKVLSIQEEQE